MPGCCNENVTLKYNFAKDQVFCDNRPFAASDHVVQNRRSVLSRATRAARLFFLIQPIKSLIRGAVVAVPVVVSLTPY